MTNRTYVFQCDQKKIISLINTKSLKSNRAYCKENCLNFDKKDIVNTIIKYKNYLHSKPSENQVYYRLIVMFVETFRYKMEETLRVARHSM